MNFFDSAYKGIPPWDIGRPQKEFVRLAEEGEISGRVLDVGCGTGENALYHASVGFEVWGIDAAPSAIKKAKEKAKKRGIKVNFMAGDALRLQLLQNKFDTIIDCGLFHVFSDEERPIFAASLSSVLYPGGKYFILCFSEHALNLLNGSNHTFFFGGEFFRQEFSKISVTDFSPSCSASATMIPSGPRR